MGGIERRLEALERLWGMDDPQVLRDLVEERRAEIHARLQRNIDSDGGAGEISPRRQRAIEDFLESVRRRRGA